MRVRFLGCHIQMPQDLQICGIHKVHALRAGLTASTDLRPSEESLAPKRLVFYASSRAGCSWPCE